MGPNGSSSTLLPGSKARGPAMPKRARVISLSSIARTAQGAAGATSHISWNR